MSVNVMRLLPCAILLWASLSSLGPAPGVEWTSPARRGVGFVIGTDGQVLTNAQVVEGCDDVQAQVGERTVNARVVASDAVNDLALLKLEGRVPEGPSIRTTGPVKGEEIVRLGITTGRRATSATGVITGLRGTSTNDTRVLQISGPTVFPHDIGSPLLDHSGHVIGVVWWPLSAKGAGSAGYGVAGTVLKSGLAIKPAIVQAFLDAYGVPYKASGPSSSREVSDITEEAIGYSFPIECGTRPSIVSETSPPVPNQESAAVGAPAPDLQDGHRAVLYEEDPNHPSGHSFAGTVMWRIEQATSAPEQKPDVVVHADIDIPHKFSMRWSLRRNDDKGLHASHVIEVAFTFSPDSNRNAVSKVPGVMVKAGEATRGVALNGVSVQVSDRFFLIGLASGVEADMKRNVELLKEKSWVDIPVVYGDGKRALVAFERGRDGTRALADAFAAWEDAGEAADASPKNKQGQTEP
jgi:hypothetical protein